MKFKFKDKISKDMWTESYNSIDDISDEIKEGCKITLLLDCKICKKEFEPKNKKDILNEICKECAKNV